MSADADDDDDVAVVFIGYLWMMKRMMYNDEVDGGRKAEAGGD